ncbi:MAG: NADH:flavin oxidoreductase [Deltaproteobacteria bacterium]|nr:MAG: NADH:flavin oxidoreductase [Deltaproteobacteria bacterium]
MEREMMLFQPFEFSGMKIRNRVVSVPVVSNLATEDGFVTDDLIERYHRIAAGGTGWIITEDVVVISRKSPYNLRIWDDKFIPGLKTLTDTVHEVPDAKIGIQLGHFLKIAMSGYRQKVEDLTREEIKQIVEDHVQAAIRVEKAGFDSLEWDAESCMTLSMFLSRSANNRKDEYGGKLENRLRLVMEIYHGTREVLGNDFILGARINGDDLVLGGNTLLHSTEIAKRLCEEGIDYISVSCGGQWEDALPTREKEPPSAYTGYSGLRCWPRRWDPDGANVYLSEGIRKAIRKAGYTVPVITAGKIPMPDFAEEVLQDGRADLIGLGRPLLCDPDWGNKAMEGRGEDIVRCIYCNHCADVNDLMLLTDCIQWPKGSKNAPLPFLPKHRRKVEMEAEA